jgi:NADH-quinone oxidoreductase subunit J
MILKLFILTGVLIGALSALFCRQTIYALLSLMITFIMSAFYFMQIKIYFISAILIIVYIGAITMLFLYVIMFLDIKKYAKFFPYSWRKRLTYGIFF